jgi:regulator of protease activity HflC (stomatin/prohibitin superfamily)
MFLIVLGIFTILFAAFIAKTAPKAEKIGSIGRYVGAALVIMGVLFGFMVQIDPGEVGVKKLFGKVQSGVLREGLNFINPLLEVERFDIRTQNYTMSSARGEGEKMGDNVLRVLSADGLEVEIDMTILFSLTPESAPVLLQTVGRGYRDVIVRPITRTKVRDFAAYYDAVSLYSVKRDEFQQRLFSAIEKEFKDRGLVLEQVLIRNINLPESVKMAIEAKINAEQESQKMRFVLDKEKQEAERKRVEAQGIADYQRILTASLTDKLLQYEQIKAQKELAGSPNAKIVIMNGKGAPLLVQ